MKNDFIDAKPGTVFKNGKIYHFDKRRILVLQAWPDTRAWRKLPTQGWRHTRKYADQWFSRSLYAKSNSPTPPFEDPPDVQAGQRLLPFPAWFLAARYEMAARGETLAWDNFFNTIPDDVRTELLLFPERKWHLLNLLARCPGAFDLIHNNPALAYALASNWVFHKPAVLQPMRAARSLVRRKQREILGWLGFPATESGRHIFAKIRPRALSIEALLYLRDALRDAAVRKALTHVPRINAGVLRLASDLRYFPHVTPRLLEEVSQLPIYEEAGKSPVDFLKDILAMAEQDGWRHCPRQISSLARMYDVHDALTRRIRPQLAKRILDSPLPFPPPPFMGTRTIQPIQTAGELLEEGDAMRHCAGSYIDSVADGSYFFYRVLEPVRATLALRYDDERWVPDQLYGFHNAHVDEILHKRLFAELFGSGPVNQRTFWDNNQLPLPMGMK